MTTQRKPEFARQSADTAAAAYPEHSAPLSEGAISDYLRRNPDFFERHAALLASLNLPHASGGAVSLVERQVSMLRQKDVKRERKLKELLEVARANDALAAKIHRLALELLAAGDLSGTLNAVEAALRTAFGADLTVLVLFRPSYSPGDGPDHLESGRFVRPMRRDDPALRPFATFLGSSRPRCGQVRDAQRDFLFGGRTNEVGSTAMVPLGEKCEVGLLAIGSADANRFHPGMGFDFLARLGELVAGAVKRY